jgi:hypothetical protein
MNKYQKIALLLGLLALLIAYGKTITKIGIGAMALIGKGIVIVLATLIIIYLLKNPGEKK